MIRYSGITGRMIKSVFHRRGYHILLSLGVLFAQISTANAFPGARLAGAGADLAAKRVNSLIVLTRYCGNGARGGYDCPNEEPPPPPDGQVTYWEPRSGHYDDARPPEEVIPCDQAYYPYKAYAYARPEPEGQRPRRSRYEEEYDNSCGVRCWYRKLRHGYCGQGCDYYRFRLKDFPEGSLGDYRRRRVACRVDR